MTNFLTLGLTVSVSRSEFAPKNEKTEEDDDSEWAHKKKITVDARVNYTISAIQVFCFVFRENLYTFPRVLRPSDSTFQRKKINYQLKKNLKPTTTYIA